MKVLVVLMIFTPLTPSITRVQIKLPPRSTFPDVQDFTPHRVGEEYITKKPHEQHESESESKFEPESDFESETEVEEDEDRKENLINPYTSKTDTNQLLFHKVFLSSSPTSNDCIAVAIYGECKRLAWCRPHHKEWTIYNYGSLEIYDSIDRQMIVRQVVAPYKENPPPIVLSTPMYLAACPNLGIILATQYYKKHCVDGVRVMHTRYIYLYKLVESSKKWVEADGLDENILFLGLNMSSLIPVSDDFKALGYKRNCIYFTDHFPFIFGRGNQDDSDMGLVDIDDQFTEGLPGFKVEPEYFWPPPIWVTPSLN